MGNTFRCSPTEDVVPIIERRKKHGIEVDRPHAVVGFLEPDVLINPYPLMRTFRCLLVCMLCSVARVAAAQLTARDTAALVDAVAERIHTQFGTGVAREPSAITARNPLALPDVRFAMRVSATLHARDSSLIVAEPTRSTRRIALGAPGLVAGDTATVTLWIARCEGDIYTGSDASLAFRRVGDHWAYVERNVGGSGTANNGCPW